VEEEEEGEIGRDFISSSIFLMRQSGLPRTQHYTHAQLDLTQLNSTRSAGNK